jgi:hypothetical protein
MIYKSFLKSFNREWSDGMEGEAESICSGCSERRNPRSRINVIHNNNCLKNNFWSKYFPFMGNRALVQWTFFAQ